MTLACVMTFSACDGDTNDVDQVPTPTTGALNVNVYPASTTVILSGPARYSHTFAGNELLTGLAPGRYTAQASAPGFVDVTSGINVVAGLTSSLSLNLQPRPIVIEAPRAVYRDGSGNLVPLDATSLQSGRFFFYAWLDDEPLGIVPGGLVTGTTGDPGKPLLDEQTEYAPSFTQNLAVAWVGFMDATGTIRPVIGADVRWEIDQQYAARVNSMQFGTSDDNRSAHNYGVFDDQADTRTNNARLAAERYPLIATEYPLYNQTGFGTPFVDGATWVTLFSPDARASARIVAVATIDGEEIGKQILFKSFQPTPKIEIIKTVDTDILNLDDGHTVTWTITVTNVGTGDATEVSLSDFLASGLPSYTAGSLPPGAVAVPGVDGFTFKFPLASAFAPAPPQSSQLLGAAWSFAVLAYATVTNTSTAANPTVVKGDVAVSAGSAVTGFETAIVLNGTIQNNTAAAQAAQIAVTTANDALTAKDPACAQNTQNLALTGTFTPGVYCYSSGVTMGTDLVLDAEGNPNAEFVFRIGSTLDTPAGATITLVNGANPCNIYWQIGSAATLGADNFFVGNIVAYAAITVGDNTSVAGRLFSRSAAVNLHFNAVSAPLECVKAPGNSRTFTFTGTVSEPGTYCNEVQVLSYSNTTQTWEPVELGDEACFTAVESDLEIIKDFVADDHTTSLGQSVSVAKNVPATLRVRVINTGTGDASVISVEDAFTAALSSGALANYRLIGLSSGTLSDSDANGNDDGFDSVIGTLRRLALAPDNVATLFVTVAASVDGEYCDTATLFDDDVKIGDDTACLNVVTPELVIRKSDAPDSVLPGANYTSTITVENVGNATARDVRVSDTLGLHAALGVRAIYVSSSLDGAAGTLAGNTVTAPTVTIAAGETLTFTVVSRIPLGAASGVYCDIAMATSSNAPTVDASDCVTVPAFSALQSQLVDLQDPVAVGGDVTYFSVLYVEDLSNEGVSNTKLTYSFGLTNPTPLGGAGEFEATSTSVYLDSHPVRDPTTGLVLSDASSATAVLLTEGASADYTADNALPGRQVIQMAADVILQPDTALYVVHVVLIPSGIPASRLYTTSYIWGSDGLISATHYEASSSEPTTVLP